jgi:hypothetical protein
MNENKLAFASLLNPFAYYLSAPAETRKKIRNVAFGKLRTVEERKKLSMGFKKCHQKSFIK